MINHDLLFRAAEYDDWSLMKTSVDDGHCYDGDVAVCCYCYDDYDDGDATTTMKDYSVRRLRLQRPFVLDVLG